MLRTAAFASRLLQTCVCNQALQTASCAVYCPKGLSAHSHQSCQQLPAMPMLRIAVCLLMIRVMNVSTSSNGSGTVYDQCAW